MAGVKAPVFKRDDLGFDPWDPHGGKERTNFQELSSDLHISLWCLLLPIINVIRYR